MKAFAALLDSLDRTTSTNERVAAIVAYLRAVEPSSAAFATSFLAGKRIPRALPRGVLRDVVLALTGTPEWLYDRCLESVGDGAETCVLLLDRLAPEPAEDRPLSAWARDLKALGKKPDEEQRALVGAWLRGLSSAERLALVKLLFGEFRVGVSSVLVVRAVAEAFATTPETVAGNLVDFDPFAEKAEPIGGEENALAPLLHATVDRPRPYPFQLAAPLEAAPDTLGARDEYQAEWKWDGIRGQALVDDGAVLLWSRGEEIVTHVFPEIVEQLARFVPSGTTLDGEILAFEQGRPRPFTDLQTRLGRKTVSKKLRETVPCSYVAYDLLRLRGEDLRERPLAERRQLLEALFAERPAGVELSAVVAAPSWEALAEERATSRTRGVEGLMLKRLDAPYGAGRHRGPSWKWKIDPETIDAVLTYAQPGSGKRANLLTDYTFGIWDGDALVTVAKAYSGLDNAEIAELDSWLRAHTLERFGPVRSIEPALVFELAFDAIGPSKRHKSGVALRFPRIARWRRDKTARDADTVERVRALASTQPAAEEGLEPIDVASAGAPRCLGPGPCCLGPEPLVELSSDRARGGRGRGLRRRRRA